MDKRSNVNSVGEPAANNNNNIQASQADILAKIENAFDTLQHFLRTDGNPLNFQRETISYIDLARSTLVNLLSAQDFKTTFFISKKIEKVLAPILAALAHYDDITFPLKQILNVISPSPTAISPETVELTKYIKHSCEIIQAKKPNPKHATAHALCSNALDSLIESINNQGTIQMLRGKIDIALGFLIRALEARALLINSPAHQFQIGIIFINISFCFKSMNQIEKASKLLTKAILILENLEKEAATSPQAANPPFVESILSFTSLLELLFNKGEKDFKVSETSFAERLIYLLGVCYKFYSDILSKLSKTQEAEYCQTQSESLMQQFKKKKKQLLKAPSANSSISSNPVKVLASNSSSSSNAPLTSKNIKTAFNKEHSVIQDDNFSQASFQTVNTSTQSTTPFGGQPISKDDIIFQKYIKLNEVRYKIIILQIRESNCVQIILYSKPIDFLRKIFIGFSSLVEYSHKIQMPNAFSSQEPLNEFFREISKRLVIEKGNLKIRDLEYYNSIEEFQKHSKILPKGFTSMK